MSNDLTSTFEIRELTGPKRLVRLRGRGLPYRPFTLDGKQRNSIDWYVGSPVGTVQVYGASEEPTTINGWWKDIFLGAFTTPGQAAAELVVGTATVLDNGDEAIGLQSSVVSTASELADIVDSIRRSGQQVEVSWLNKVRRGILDQFVQKWHNGHDLEFEIRFAWTSQAEALSDVAVKDDHASSVGDLPNAVANLLSDVAADVDVVEASDERGQDASDVLRSLSSTLAAMGDELTDAVSSIGDVLTTPNETLLRVAGILDGIKMTADDLVTMIHGIADGMTLDSGTKALTSSLALPPGQVYGVAATQRTFGQVLAVRADQRARAESAIALRNYAATQQAALINRLTSTIIQVFQARDGQDLRNVSIQFYGSEAGWRGLMVYNHLASSQLRAGQVVFVPSKLPEGV